ncbi:hypothetical protein D3C85_1351080 [compost metagenome]
MSIRAQHFQLHWLVGQRLAITVAQQTVEDHRLARTIKIARTKHEELLAVTRCTGDIKFRQIERREFEIKKRGLPVFTGQNQRGFFIGF